MVEEQIMDKKPGRLGQINRTTGETSVALTVDLDGGGRAHIDTGVPFLDHMLTLLAVHGSLDLDVQARGDVAVDGHHTVEDVGICLGQAVKQALGDKGGIERYGHGLVPMDEALAEVVLDFSGRGFLVFELPLPATRVGDFDTELVEEFMQALASNGALTLHVRLLAGKNTHHIIEAAFKALGRAMRMAATVSNPGGGVPSTKGVL